MYPQSTCMLWNKNKKIRHTPANPSYFSICKCGLREFTFRGHVFLVLMHSNLPGLFIFYYCFNVYKNRLKSASHMSKAKPACTFARSEH